ncbi:hypothetical protein [Pasteurella multocida]
MFGDEPQTEVTLRELTTGDLLDAELQLNVWYVA